MSVAYYAENEHGLGEKTVFHALGEAIAPYGTVKKALILPPDMTRGNSYAGPITCRLYEMLGQDCQVDILPALGTHMPMSEGEIGAMYPGIPAQRFIVHKWREDVVKIGEVPAAFVREVSEGLMDEAIDVEVNKHLLDPSYDLIVSVGQVVPHEVVGMANYSKNIFVGCGGFSMLNKTHFLGALYGMERMMGRDDTPVRRVLDYAQGLLTDIPLLYVLTVTSRQKDVTCLDGLFIGTDRQPFEKAVALSQQKNLVFLDQPLKKVVCYLEPEEFKTTWVGNKAIYRTRMAIADNGELIVIAPGVHRFGEDMDNDALIRKYGYFGRDQTLAWVRDRACSDLGENLSVAAHLIHGSSDGRFRISYAPGHLSQAEVENAGFAYLPLEQALEKYDIGKLRDGLNTVDGEEIFYVSNPALGLWAHRERFFQQ
ncbi:MAG: lactate racemase domain-containing protein [Christensenellales bacterium]